MTQCTPGRKAFAWPDVGFFRFGDPIISTLLRPLVPSTVMASSIGSKHTTSDRTDDMESSDAKLVPPLIETGKTLVETEQPGSSIRLGARSSGSPKSASGGIAYVCEGAPFMCVGVTSMLIVGLVCGIVGVILIVLNDPVTVSCAGDTVEPTIKCDDFCDFDDPRDAKLIEFHAYTSSMRSHAFQL